MGCQCHFFFLILLISLYLSTCLIFMLFLSQTLWVYSKKSERLFAIHKRALRKFTIGCFIIVSQVLSRGVRLVTGCLAMAMLLRPVRKTAKSFRWNRQVPKIPLHPTLCFHNKDGVQYTICQFHYKLSSVTALTAT